jgi:hypothetical protein
MFAAELGLNVGISDHEFLDRTHLSHADEDIRFAEKYPNFIFMI